MALQVQHYLLVTFLIMASITPRTSAQPPTADDIIEKDRQARHILFNSGKNVAGPPQRGFFGTIFHVILEQINDTKSAYNQISELVSNQFADENAVTPAPDLSNNGTTETPKLTRSEFLRILDRNLKGLSRLRNLEWREAKKRYLLQSKNKIATLFQILIRIALVNDTAANLRAYMDEIFRGKRSKNST